MTAKEEPKQETFEEAAERLYPVCIKPILDKYDDGVTNVIGEENVNEDCKNAFIEGAKWQQERIFELVEEYNQMLVDPNVHEDHKEKSFKDWFEQFKKK